MKINLFFSILITLFSLISFFSSYTQAKVVTIHNLQVTHIIDGDTIWVKNEKGKNYKIRFLGINAPEICTTPIEPLGIEAKNYVEKLLKSEKVYIIYDSNNYKDKYNRIVAHIYREKDNLWINASLVKKGLAYVYILCPHVLYLNDLIVLENQARKTNLNIWNLDYYKAITPEETINYVNQYKLIIGKIHKINSSKQNNIWLEFQATNNKPTKAIKPCLSVTSVPLKVANNLRHTSKTVFSVKIQENKIPGKVDWEKYKNKIVIVRGYINQYNKNYAPIVNMVNSHTIELFSDS